MKKVVLLYLFCISFLGYASAQTKESSQSKNAKSTVIPSKKNLKPVVKKELKPKATMQPKETKPVPKKNDEKKQPQQHLVQKVISGSSKHSTDSDANKKTLAKTEDTGSAIKPNIKQSADTQAGSNKPVAVQGESIPTKPIKIPSQPESSFSFVSSIPYIVILGLIILLGVIFTRGQKRVESLGRQLKQLNEEDKYKVNNFKTQVQKLENEKNGFIQQIDQLTEQLRVEKRKNKVVEVESQQNIESLIQQEIIQPVKQESPIKYARYADQGDGFTVSDLLNEEDNDTIFQITLTTANTATFKVADNLNAQKYALSNTAYFLGKTCKYDSTPSQSSIIRTDSLGELKLQGGSKWVIINPATISFI